MNRTLTTAVLAFLALASPVWAQQRPLVTEDPETIGSGNVLIEGGVDVARDILYPVSGLQGDLLRVPTLGVSFGLSSIAELQIDGGLYNRLSITSRRNAPLSGMLDVTGDTTSDVEDIVIGTKIRVLSETEARPAVGIRFATKLPNASNESGLGLDTTDFHATALFGKTVQSIRVVGNAGLGILGDPTRGDRQNDVLLYGLSVARAVQQGLEVVGEINGRANTRGDDAPPGTDSRATIRVGGRFTRSTVRIDAGVLLGMTSRDPGFGFTVGATWVFKGYTVP
jgi:Putative MetA-pathway of phenol degradation